MKCLSLDIYVCPQVHILLQFVPFVFCYPTNTTLVCDLSDIKFAVVLSISLFVSRDRYLGAGATDQRESLHDGRSVIWTKLLSFWWRYH